ncbi:ATP-binding cassette (ABC) Superfamily, partial [Phytophthora palmivora]
MDTGNQRQLNFEDLWEMEGKNRSATALDEFMTHYERHDKSIVKAMMTAYGGEFFLWGLAMLFSTACGLFAPVVLNHVIGALSMVEIDLTDLSVWLGIFFVSRFVNAILSVQMNYALEMIALRLTVALKTLLFQKAMRRRLQTKTGSGVVDISNLLTSDIYNILWAAFQVNKLWIIPIQIVVAVWMLYIVIDLAAFAGLSVIVVSMLASYCLAKYSGDAFVSLMQRKDDRLGVIKEVFGAIQIVKLNAWEDKFADKIRHVRSIELSAVKRYLYLGAVNITILWSSPLAVSAVSFSVYAIVMGNELTAAKVFTAIALFNALRDPLRDLPSVIQ